jgi:hypothetical protein
VIRRHCLILSKNRSSKSRARWKHGLKQVGSLSFRIGAMFATGECPDPIDIHIHDPQRICIAKRNLQCAFNAFPFHDAVVRRGPVAARRGKAGR